MFTIILLSQVSFAESNTNWKTLKERLYSSETHWRAVSDLDWLLESNTNWHLDPIDKDDILTVEAEFAVVNASWGCFDDGKYCPPASEEDAVLLSIGVGYLVYDNSSGDYWLGPLIGTAIGEEIEWPDGTVDVLYKGVDGDLIVSTDHGGAEPDW